MEGQLEKPQASPSDQDPTSTAVAVHESSEGDTSVPSDSNSPPAEPSTVSNDVVKDEEVEKAREDSASAQPVPDQEPERVTRNEQEAEDPSTVPRPSADVEEPVQSVSNDEPAPPLSSPVPSKSVTPPSRPSTLPPLPPHANQLANGIHDSRPQSPALTVTPAPASNLHKRSMTTSKGSHMSVVLISAAMETIAASREAKRSAPFRDGIQNALELVKRNEAIDRPREILEPLRLACETRNEKLVIASLDCISKLVSYSFFADDSEGSAANGYSPPPSPGGAPKASDHQPSLVDLVASTIASCQNESTSDTISVQIVKALLGLVLSQTTFAHHHSLLQSVRTVYNVYLTSNSPQIQMLAQGSLTQMVDHIFNRCKTQEPVPETPSHRSLESLSSTLGSIKADADLPPIPSSSENVSVTSQSPNATPVTPSIKLPEGDAEQQQEGDSSQLEGTDGPTVQQNV